MCVLTALSAVSAQAADTGTPAIHKFSFDDNVIVTKMSDNGAWAVASSGSAETTGAKPRLIDLSSDEATVIQTTEEATKDGACLVNDVTNEGDLVVGSLKGQPAYWNKATRTWTTLPVPEGCAGGQIYAVTPDGKYGVGSATYSQSEYMEKGVMWDLAAKTIVDLPNLPTKDMTHEDQNQQRFSEISADGRYVLASMSFSYVKPTALCSYLYDRQNGTYKFLGFTPSDDSAWTPLVDGLYYVDAPVMSANGKYVAAIAYMVKGDTEYSTVGVYDVEKDKFEVQDAVEDQGYMPCAVDNSGTVYGATPTTSPIREWSVRYNGYWYPISQILLQGYGVDFYKKTNYDNTGTPYSVTSDGTKFVTMVDPLGSSYLLELPEPATKACEGIDLLTNYGVTPASGSTFTRLETVELTFDRDIAVTSGAEAALKDSVGNVVRSSIDVSVSSKNSKAVIVTFRSQVLEAGKSYTVEIPAGVISLKGDGSKTNKAISIPYIGRADAPLKVMNIYPADNSELGKIDNSSQPVVLTFDAEVAKTDTAGAALYNATTNEVVAPLNFLVSGKGVAVYPTSTQYLYKDQNYYVRVNAGAFTDITGNGANEALTINYKGSYVRQLSTSDETLFFDDFSNTSQSWNNFMRYDGDKLTPTTEMAGWGFDAENQPWNFQVKDADVDDFCAASTSMYSPAGQSDDWMVIPQLDITDDNSSLSFLAQSYKKDKQDRLKVVVWANEANINILNAATIEKMKTEGDVVFDEQLNPGLSEDELADDWTKYTVDLAKYKGKKIYIGFWNNNNDQSTMFVDSIQVKRSLKYLLSLTNAESVVDQENVAIGGRLTANSDVNTYSTVKLTLNDADGNEIDNVEQTGLALKKGDKFDFNFTKPLPLAKGETNNFTIKVQLDDYSDVQSSSVKNLVFKPVKRVVLEENTGVTCVNCPLGILAIENLEKTYGNLFIPVSIHAYTGDPLGNGVTEYASYLGLSSAPSGKVNRNSTVIYPMWTSPITGNYEFSNGYTLWADYVKAELEANADAELTATGITVDPTNKKFTIPLELKSALNAKNQMLNLFMVVVEDSIISYQTNTYSSVADPALGKWGKGGEYGQPTVYNVVHNDVARATFGSSYSGTQGLFPQTLEAGKTYNASLSNVSIPENIKTLSHAKAIIMLIDANTDKIVNAVSVKFSDDPTGIDHVQSSNGGLSITAHDGYVDVTATGDVKVTLHSLTGALIGSAKGNGNVSVSTNGYHGAVIVKAAGGTTVTTKKLMVK